MKIGLISDTHNVVKEEVVQILKECDEIWHCGDFCNEKTYHQIENIAPLYAVRGNNDKEAFFDCLPEIRILKRNGFAFALCHYKEKLENIQADRKCFGHSHQLFCQDQWLNPGGCGRKRFSCGLSMMVLDITDHVEVEIIRFPGE